MSVLLENTHWVASLEVGLVRIRRSDVPYADAEACVHALALLEEALLDVPTAALLIDSHIAKGTQDPEIERAIMQFTARMTQRFARVATLVASSVGLLQSQRLIRSRSAPVRVFDDEHKAIAYLSS